MSYDDNYILQIDGEDMEVEGAYDHYPSFPFEDASSYAKTSDETCRLYHIDGEGNRHLVAEYLPSGDMIQTRFIFVSEEDEVIKTIEFPDLYKALDYAQDWTLAHRLPDGKSITARILSGKSDRNGGYEWITSWVFDYPEEITISYTPGFGTWFFIENVPNISEDLIECLMACDREVAEHISPDNISLKWEGDCTDLWKRDLFEDLGNYLDDQIVHLMKWYKFTMMEAIMFVLDNATDFDNNEISEFIEEYLGMDLSDILIMRYLDDAYLKLKILGIELEKMHYYKIYNDIKTKNRITLR